MRPATGRNGLRFEYELLFDGDVEASAPQMIGLINVEELASTTVTSQGSEPDLAPRLQAARTDLVPTMQSAESSENSSADAALSAVGGKGQQEAPLRKRSTNDRSRNARASAPSSEIPLLAADAGG